MEVKWTPGPWLASSTSDGRSTAVYPEAEPFAPVGRVLLRDAHLIAAAPDLYAALELLLKANAREGEFADDRHSSEAWGIVVDQAIAALAKARGEK